MLDPPSEVWRVERGGGGALVSDGVAPQRDGRVHELGEVEVEQLEVRLPKQRFVKLHEVGLPVSELLWRCGLHRPEPLRLSEGVGRAERIRLAVVVLKSHTRCAPPACLERRLGDGMHELTLKCVKGIGTCVLARASACHPACSYVCESWHCMCQHVRVRGSANSRLWRVCRKKSVSERCLKEKSRKQQPACCSVTIEEGAAALAASSPNSSPSSSSPS
uniref:Uncharacterized protein n=1 Tax=Chrysotila carterae TaxID=13221 RepID=A0A7S4BJ78_CHRCT